MADKRTVTLDPRAESDLFAAVEWYDQHAPGLGDRFIESIDAIVDGITEYPRMYPAVEEDVRRALMKQFPYVVYYRLEEQSIRVVAGFIPVADRTTGTSDRTVVRAIDGGAIAGGARIRGRDDGWVPTCVSNPTPVTGQRPRGYSCRPHTARPKSSAAKACLRWARCDQ